MLEEVVVLHHGRRSSDELTTEIKTCVKTSFAARAYPRNVHYVSELPKRASGKIQCFAVLDDLREAAHGQSAEEKIWCG